MSPQKRSTIRELLAEHGLHPDASLGQHFLADPNIVRKIVATAAVGSGQGVIEIGAGTGTLTAALADTGADVIAYEVDERLRPVLQSTLGPRRNVEVRYRDAVDEDWALVTAEGRWTVVANLPYHVGTPIVLDMLRHAPHIVRLVVMVQREVADRLRAGPGSRTYGLPSVIAGIHAEVTVAFGVPPQVFVPAPAVESSVVVLQRREAPAEAERAIELAAAAFGQRRKMLRKSMTTAVPDATELLLLAGLEPTARAEDLAPEDYLRLAATEQAT